MPLPYSGKYLRLIDRLVFYAVLGIFQGGAFKRNVFHALEYIIIMSL